MKLTKWVLALTMMTMAACSKSDDTPSGGTAVVKYEVKGTNVTQLQITYTNASGAEQSGTVSATDWSQEITVSKPFQAKVTAIGTKPSGLTATPVVKVQIYVNGTSIGESEVPGLNNSGTQTITASISRSVN